MAKSKGKAKAARKAKARKVGGVTGMTFAPVLGSYRMSALVRACRDKLHLSPAGTLTALQACAGKDRRTLAIIVRDLFNRDLPQYKGPVADVAPADVKRLRAAAAKAPRVKKAA